MPPPRSRIKIPDELLRRSSRLRPIKQEVDDSDTATGIKREPLKRQPKTIKSEPNNHHEIEPKKVKILKVEPPKLIDIKSLPPIITATTTTTGYGRLDRLHIHCDELDLERTLMGGQSFRWTKEGDIFTGVIHDYAIRLWRVSDEEVAVESLSSYRNDFELKVRNALLRDYFRFSYNLRERIKNWTLNDDCLAEVVKDYRGFRILRQDPVENVFSFICATNNNIKRISQMVENMCKKYGRTIQTCDDVKQTYYEFPDVEQLAGDDVFQCLRYELGFGYRAKFIVGAARHLIEHSRAKGFENVRSYLLSMRQMPYKEVVQELMMLPGVGRKVADCICLMSMEKLEAVPVDCHIYEIVCRNYLRDLKLQHKTLTDKVHDKIHDFFANFHGQDAGWSTSILFIAELKHLKVENDKAKVKKTTTTKRAKKLDSRE